MEQVKDLVRDVETDPRLIEFCMQCTQTKCTGDCDAIMNERRRLYGRRKHSGRRAILYEYHGEKHSLIEWQRITGINEVTMRGRLKRGMTFEEAMEFHGHGGAPSKLYTHEGRTMTIREWSEVTGVPYNTIYDRIRRGESFESAIRKEEHELFAE